MNQQNRECMFEFEGIGFVLTGGSQKEEEVLEEYSQRVEVYLDDELVETVDLPTRFITRRHDICWRYNLTNQKHTVRLNLLNPKPGYRLWLGDVIVYSDKQMNYSY